MPLSRPTLMSVPVDAVRPRISDGAEVPLHSGTGFIVQHDGDYFFVTNGHVVTGRAPGSDIPLSAAAQPKKLLVWLTMATDPDANVLGWHAHGWDLYDSAGRARWFVHPVRGRSVDVVALPIEGPETIVSGHETPTVYSPYVLNPVERPAALYPTAEVSVVGFPDQVVVGGKLPVWTRASVASEPAVDYSGEPCFLIDARTRPGQSGSPVIGYWIGPRVLASGVTYVGGEDFELFGIYSARLSESSDLGRVWRRDVIREIIEAGHRDSVLYEEYI